MAEAEIAVIIPNFQRKERLRRALASVLRQSLRPVEIVVVDDASTVDLTDVREEAEREGIRWIARESNGGPALARNEGVAATRSPWIAFLDSDDEWAPTKLERQWDWHGNHAEVRISQVKERWVRHGAPVAKPGHWEPGEGDLFAASVERCSIGPSCVMMHRSLWEESGGFDPRFRVCEDYALWLRITSLEWVGKLPGDALVEKEGGGSDQLSRTTPAMDRYRVVALLETLSREPLSGEQRDLVIDGVRKRGRILAQGAAKRGQEERASLYRTLAETNWEAVSPSVFGALLERAWAETAAGTEDDRRNGTR